MGNALYDKQHFKENRLTGLIKTLHEIDETLFKLKFLPEGNPNVEPLRQYYTDARGLIKTALTTEQKRIKEQDLYTAVKRWKQNRELANTPLRVQYHMKYMTRDDRSREYSQNASYQPIQLENGLKDIGNKLFTTDTSDQLGLHSPFSYTLNDDQLVYGENAELGVNIEILYKNDTEKEEAKNQVEIIIRQMKSYYSDVETHTKRQHVDRRPQKTPEFQFHNPDGYNPNGRFRTGFFLPARVLNLMQQYEADRHETHVAGPARERLASEIASILKTLKTQEHALALTQQIKLADGTQNIYEGTQATPSISDILSRACFGESGCLVIMPFDDIKAYYDALLKKLASENEPKINAFLQVLKNNGCLASNLTKPEDLMQLESNIQKTISTLLPGISGYRYKGNELASAFDNALTIIITFLETFLYSASREKITLPEGMTIQLIKDSMTPNMQRNLGGFVSSNIREQNKNYKRNTSRQAQPTAENILHHLGAAYIAQLNTGAVQAALDSVQFKQLALPGAQTAALPAAAAESQPSSGAQDMLTAGNGTEEKAGEETAALTQGTEDRSSPSTQGMFAGSETEGKEKTETETEAEAKTETETPALT